MAPNILLKNIFITTPWTSKPKPKVPKNLTTSKSKSKKASVPPCGRSKGEKRKNYPKCVPLAKARAMTPSQRRAAVLRKKKAQRKGSKGKKPSYAKT